MPTTTKNSLKTAGPIVRQARRSKKRNNQSQTSSATARNFRQVVETSSRAPRLTRRLSALRLKSCEVGFLETDSIECHPRGNPQCKRRSKYNARRAPHARRPPEGSRCDRRRPEDFSEFRGMDSRYPALRRTKDSNPAVHPVAHPRKSNATAAR